jgi:hypothetical protein
VKHPPPPSFVGQVAPEPIRRALASELPSDADNSVQVVVFVTTTCGACEDLISGIRTAIARGRLSRDDVLFVVWALPESGWRTFASALPARYVSDIDGVIGRAGEIRASPASFAVSREDWIVVDYNMGGDGEWIISQINSAPKLQPTA